MQRGGRYFLPGQEPVVPFGHGPVQISFLNFCNGVDRQFDGLCVAAHSDLVKAKLCEGPSIRQSRGKVGQDDFTGGQPQE